MMIFQFHSSVQQSFFNSTFSWTNYTQQSVTIICVWDRYNM